MILLDTNVCIRILRGRKEALDAFSANAGNVAVPFMALGELYYGAARSADPKRGKYLVDSFSRILPIVHASQETMARFGEEKARLAVAGSPVEDADILIASIALVNGFQVATGNIRHFSRFEGLDILVW